MELNQPEARLRVAGIHDPHDSGSEDEDNEDDIVDHGPTAIQAHVELAKTPRKCSAMLVFI